MVKLLLWFPDTGRCILFLFSVLVFLSSCASTPPNDVQVKTPEPTTNEDAYHDCLTDCVFSKLNVENKNSYCVRQCIHLAPPEKPQNSANDSSSDYFQSGWRSCMEKYCSAYTGKGSDPQVMQQMLLCSSKYCSAFTNSK